MPRAATPLWNRSATPHSLRGRYLSAATKLRSRHCTLQTPHCTLKKQPKGCFFIWRRRGDSNSCAGYPTYALSRGASSPT